ncbi:unnamed protein product [Danaus chrysippus]|uniref:(African queen) hypothetical protein n=1 Tax=Danaus chrysippus TaxID=151541 RepID=A0A8J2R1E0_9NEOP|nr:unnamed protein product [Danaus chrysippus]
MTTTPPTSPTLVLQQCREDVAARNRRDELVQCVPTKKGHLLLYKGYTYVFKSRLQCGAEQWYCSYRQKTGCISVINMQTYGVQVHNNTLNNNTLGGNKNIVTTDKL